MKRLIPYSPCKGSQLSQSQSPFRKGQFPLFLPGGLSRRWAVPVRSPSGVGNHLDRRPHRRIQVGSDHVASMEDTRVKPNEKADQAVSNREYLRFLPRFRPSGRARKAAAIRSTRPWALLGMAFSVGFGIRKVSMPQEYLKTRDVFSVFMCTHKLICKIRFQILNRRKNQGGKGSQSKEHAIFI